jgi:pimeloyl-ACP methyl ester carboxylesterase
MKGVQMKTSNLLILLLIFFIQIDKASSQVQPIKVNFISDGYKLNAEMYHSAAEKPIPTLILMHGYPGGEGDPLGLGQKLSQLGINVFVFNYQGTWSSEGTFSFKSSVGDVHNALKFIKQKETVKNFNVDTTNIIVGGYSFGGAMALTAAMYNDEIKRIISIAGADESVLGRKWQTNPQFRNSLKSMLESTIFPQGGIRCEMDTVLGEWLGDLDYYDQVKHAENLKNDDILFLGGWDDPSCIVEEIIIPLYRRFRELNAENIKIRMFETDHSFSNVREELAVTIQNWIIDNAP